MGKIGETIPNYTKDNDRDCRVAALLAMTGGRLLFGGFFNIIVIRYPLGVLRAESPDGIGATLGT